MNHGSQIIASPEKPESATAVELVAVSLIICLHSTVFNCVESKSPFFGFAFLCSVIGYKNLCSFLTQ